MSSPSLFPATNPGAGSSRLGRTDAIAAKFDEARRLARFDESQCALYRRLSALRARLALEAALPAYQILSNRQLILICEAPPSSESMLSSLPGMNRLKMLAFGAELLATIRTLMGGHAVVPERNGRLGD